MEIRRSPKQFTGEQFISQECSVVRFRNGSPPWVAGDGEERTLHLRFIRKLGQPGVTKPGYESPGVVRDRVASYVS